MREEKVRTGQKEEATRSFTDIAYASTREEFIARGKFAASSSREHRRGKNTVKKPCRELDARKTRGEKENKEETEKSEVKSSFIRERQLRAKTGRTGGVFRPLARTGV